MPGWSWSICGSPRPWWANWRWRCGRAAGLSSKTPMACGSTPSLRTSPSRRSPGQGSGRRELRAGTRATAGTWWLTCNGPASARWRAARIAITEPGGDAWLVARLGIERMRDQIEREGASPADVDDAPGSAGGLHADDHRRTDRHRLGPVRRLATAAYRKRIH